MKKITDYLGNEFSSIKEMCKVYEIDYNKYVATAHNLKRANGRKPKKKRRTKIELSNGLTFNSIKEATEYFNMPYQCVVARINDMHWNVERALTTPSKGREKSQSISCTDGTNEYSSLAEMARATGISKWTIYQRHHRKRDLVRNTEVKDHLGNKYNSKAEMYKAYGVTAALVYSRLHQGWTLEEALTGRDRWICYDHLGNAYKNEREMCGAYNVNINTFRAKKRKGVSLENIFTNRKENAV